MPRSLGGLIRSALLIGPIASGARDACAAGGDSLIGGPLFPEELVRAFLVLTVLAVVVGLVLPSRLVAWWRRGRRAHLGAWMVWVAILGVVLGISAAAGNPPWEHMIGGSTYFACLTALVACAWAVVGWPVRVWERRRGASLHPVAQVAVRLAIALGLYLSGLLLILPASLAAHVPTRILVLGVGLGSAWHWLAVAGRSAYRGLLVLARTRFVPFVAVAAMILAPLTVALVYFVNGPLQDITEPDVFAVVVLSLATAVVGGAMTGLLAAVARRRGRPFRPSIIGIVRSVAGVSAGLGFFVAGDWWT